MPPMLETNAHALRDNPGRVCVSPSTWRSGAAALRQRRAPRTGIDKGTNASSPLRLPRSTVWRIHPRPNQGVFARPSAGAGSSSDCPAGNQSDQSLGGVYPCSAVEPIRPVRLRCEGRLSLRINSVEWARDRLQTDPDAGDGGAGDGLFAPRYWWKRLKQDTAFVVQRLA